MDAPTLRSYKERWEEVSKVEEVERLQATPALRWQQLNSILRMAAALELTFTSDGDGEAEIWQRWNVLRDGFHHGGQGRSD